MTPAQTPKARAALRLASLICSLSVAAATLAVARPARAQDPSAALPVAPSAAPAAAPATPPPPAAVVAPPPAAVPPPPEPPPPEMPPPPPANDIPGFVETLPGSAYPTWQLRGLAYGSLERTTMHGMQWPYIPRSGVGVSGDAWLDTGYQRIDRSTASTNEPHTVKYMLQQGRAVFRLTPTYNAETWFAQAQAELVANKDQTLTQPNVVDVDDLWVRAGAWRSWDVTIGRFQGFEVYHLGMGLDLNTLERNGATDEIRSPPGIHGFQYGFLRPPNVGNVAFHLYPGSRLRVELMAQLGNEGGLNTLGGRPAVIYDLGWLKLKVAGEGRRQTAIADTSAEERTTYGGTGAVQFVFDPRVEFGLNVDWGHVTHYKATKTNSTDAKGQYDREGSVDTLSFGGFANVRVIDRVLFGLGGNFVTEEDDLPNTNTFENGKFWHLQAFAALQYAFNARLFIKVVAGYARAHLAPSTGAEDWDNSMGSGRVRLQYFF